jgi:hypothetical protein
MSAMMKDSLKTLLLVLIFLTSSWTQPCENYSCDSLALRAILDTNGFSFVSVELASDSQNGRITEIQISDQAGFKILPSIIGNITGLKRLILNGLALESLPDEICSLSNMENMTFDRNKIKQIPDSIGKITNLRRLGFYSNLITEVPPSIGNLINLTQLTLKHNQISHLPNEIGNLSSLTTLYLDNNELTSLADSIVKLSNFNTVTLQHNKLCNLPPAQKIWADWVCPGWQISQDCQTSLYIAGSIDIVIKNKEPQAKHYNLLGQFIPDMRTASIQDYHFASGNYVAKIKGTGTKLSEKIVIFP